MIEEQIQENRKLWVAALRSGEYSQCKGVMTYQGSYCAFGVAHKIFNGDEYSWWLNFLGLEQDKVDELLDMNDNEGKSFSEIADYIEANLIKKS